METFVEILVRGALTGAVLALLALGFSLVYGVGGIVNLSHGSFYMVGAYVAVTASNDWGLPLVLALVVGVAAAAVSGVVLDRVVIRPVRHQPVTVLIVTLASATFVSALIRLIYGAEDRGLDGLATGSMSLFGVDLQTTRVLAFAVSAVFVVATLVVLRFTRIGRIVRAVAQDAEAATLMGIDPGHVLLGVIAAGAALAGLAGVMVSPFEVVNPDMWLRPLVQAFAIVIVGGLGSIEGTVIAAIVLGYVDRAVEFGIPDGGRYLGLISICLILITLVVRPQGILGRGQSR